MCINFYGFSCDKYLKQNFEVAFQGVQNFGSDMQDKLRWNIHLQVFGLADQMYEGIDSSVMGTVPAPMYLN
jgi:hypothetical protein